MTMQEMFGEVISIYTREDAFTDGVLINASIGDLAEVTRQHFPAGCEVAMTAGLHALIQKAVDNPKTYNDWKGVWHDVCWMSRVLPARRVVIEPDYRYETWFEVIITGAGRKRKHLLKRYDSAVGNGVEITFMLPNED